MYNEERKERFIREFTESEHTADVYRKIFRITEKFEEAAGLDVCEMDAVTGKPVADSLVNIGGTSIEKRLNLVKQYVRWCVRNNIPGATLGFLDIVPMPPYGKIRNRMVSGPLMLKQYLDAVFDSPEKKNIHNVYRCYLWLGFAGVPGDLATEITSADVSLSERTICCLGEDFTIPEEAMPEIRNCMTLNGFTVEYPTASVRSRTIGTRILRGFSDNTNLTALRVKASEFGKKAEDKGLTDKRLTYVYTRLSGIFYRAFRNEMAGVAPDFSRDAERLEDENERTDPSIKQETRQYRISTRTRGLTQDYKRWKLVFRV